MDTAMTAAPMSMMGARMAMRTIIMKAFCTLVTSVVSRVTKEAVENRSTFLKEKSCTLSNSALRMFLANPVLAWAANFPASAPHTRLSTAMPTMTSPIFTV